MTTRIDLAAFDAFLFDLDGASPDGSARRPRRPRLSCVTPAGPGYHPLPRCAVAEQIERLSTKRFGPGDVIFREGDESQGEAYLIHEGTVEARRRLDGEERVLNILVKGDLLGEVALFRAAPHSVTAIAVEHVTLLVIPAHRLESMVRANPELAIGIIRQLARMAAQRND